MEKMKAEQTHEFIKLRDFSDILSRQYLSILCLDS